MQIATQNKQQYIQVLTLLQLEGYHWNWSTRTPTPQSMADEYYDSYKFISIVNSNKEVNLNYSQYTLVDINYPEDAAKFIDIISNSKTIEIANVGDYTAIVSKNEIQVGCQTISFEKFQEIADAVNKIQNK